MTRPTKYVHPRKAASALAAARRIVPRGADRLGEPTGRLSRAQFASLVVGYGLRALNAAAQLEHQGDTK